MNDSIVTPMAMDGKTQRCQYVRRYCCPSPTIWPQEGVGGLIPTPMNDERRLRKDRLRNPERDGDDDRGERARKDVTQQHPAGARPESAGALDELLLLDGEHLGARLPGDADPPGEPDRDEDVDEARAQHGHDEDHE